MFELANTTQFIFYKMTKTNRRHIPTVLLSWPNVDEQRF